MSDSLSSHSDLNLDHSLGVGVSNNATGSNITSSKPTSTYQINGNGNLTIATAGDFGCDSNAKNSLTNITSSNPDLVLALGDLSYAPNPDCWFSTHRLKNCCNTGSHRYFNAISSITSATSLDLSRDPSSVS